MDILNLKLPPGIQTTQDGKMNLYNFQNVDKFSNFEDIPKFWKLTSVTILDIIQTLHNISNLKNTPCVFDKTKLHLAHSNNSFNFTTARPHPQDYENMQVKTNMLYHDILSSGYCLGSHNS